MGKIISLRRARGFTLIEVLLVMGVTFALASFMSLNIFNSKASADINTTLYTFISDFKNQQTKAMVGDTEGRGIADTYGVYINSDQYILFHGANYNPGDTANFTVKLPDTFQMSTTFPSSKIVFTQGSGEVSPFTIGQNTITITNTKTNAAKTIQINKYGIITDVN
jgi:type II secretory pathway pseudopilin PulG